LEVVGNFFGPAGVVAYISPYLWEAPMKPIVMLGIALLLAGLIGLFVSRVGYTETKPIVKAGPLELDSHEDHSIWIPTAAAVAAMVAGAGLVVVGRK
jgi:hypothetical protein